MATKTLDDRRRALEESFFQTANDALLARLREEEAREPQRQALGDAMDLFDGPLIEELLDAGLRAETWMALSLVPLVEVAWADREVTPAEQARIKEAAEEKGIAAGSDARALLDGWLTQRPPPRVREAWRHYVESLGQFLDSEQYNALREATFASAREVAKATNHLLGLGGRISPAEQTALDDLATAFERTG